MKNYKSGLRWILRFIWVNLTIIYMPLRGAR